MLQMLSRPKNKLVKLQRETDMILQDITNIYSNKETSKDDDLVDVLLKIQRDPLTNDSIKSVIQVN